MSPPLNWRDKPRESHTGTVRIDKTGEEWFGIWARNVDLEEALSERDFFYNELSHVLARYRALLAALQAHEWSATTPNWGYPACPACHVQIREPHKADCWLAALLREAGA